MGIADNSGVEGPRWNSTDYTPVQSGPVTFDLDWTGGGDLRIDVRLAANNSWVASNTSTDHPKELTTSLTEGVPYRIAVWAVSGSGVYTLTANGPNGSGGTTTTTTTTPPPGEVVSCGNSLGFDICLHAEDSILTGNVDIWTTFDGPSNVFAVHYDWGPTANTNTDLLTDFEAPWSWSWPTHRYLDASGYVNVQVENPAGFFGAKVAIPVTLENGNDVEVPRNPLDWDTLFTPRPQAGIAPVIAAVGDGGDGTTRSQSVADAIHASEAEAVLFLGDMYERGTPAEWEVNWGLASFDDPGGGTGWGAMAGYMQPTLGNHEAWNLDAWTDYWHGRPLYDAFSYGGVRVINVSSECSQAGGCGVGSPQYEFVEAELTSATEACIVGIWHRPVLSSVSNASTMNEMWALFASNGGDLILNGHTHDMEIYAPMNANLQAGQPGSHMVQIISGAGGHNLTSEIATDPRNVWQVTKEPGALFLTLVNGDSGFATAIDWEFRDVDGNTVFDGATPGTGSVNCSP